MTFSTLGDLRLALHHDDEIHVYAVTREQLLLLMKGEESKWKTFCSFAFSIAITCVLNSIAFWGDENSGVLRCNMAITVVSLILGVVFWIFASWAQKETKAMLNSILSQPLQSAKPSRESMANWNSKEQP